MLEKNLKICFVNHSQNQFFSQFSSLLVIPRDKMEEVEGIYQSKSLKTTSNMTGMMDDFKSDSDMGVP